jgi:hypothetical protein
VQAFLVGRAKLLESTRRAFFKITERGRSALAENVTRIDAKFLRRFDEFNAFVAGGGTAATPSLDTSKQAVDEKAISQSTPDELLRATRYVDLSYAQALSTSNCAEALLSQVVVAGDDGPEAAFVVNPFDHDDLLVEPEEIGDDLFEFKGRFRLSRHFFFVDPSCKPTFILPRRRSTPEPLTSIWQPTQERGRLSWILCRTAFSRSGVRGNSAAFYFPFAFSPISTRRRIDSERLGWSPC